MPSFPPRAVSALVLLLALLPQASAQGGTKQLTLEDAIGGRAGPNFRPSSPSARWDAEGRLLINEGDGGRRLVLDPATMAEATAPRAGNGRDDASSPPTGRASLDGGEVVFTGVDGKKRKLTDIGGCREVHLSADGTRASFVRGNDLYVVATDGSSTWRVTEDGGETVFNGLLDWVYQEEVYGRGNFQAHWWSPDSSNIVFIRLDESKVKAFTVIDHVPTPKLDDERTVVAEVTKYPKAGDPNPVASLYIADVVGQRVVPVDLSRFKAEDEIILARVAWTPSGDRALLQVQNRIQNWLELCAVDPKDGSVTPILRESADTWVNVIEQPRFLADGSFLWWSERTGWQNLYRYALDGQLLATVTAAKFALTGIERIDEKANLVWLMGRSRSPLDVQLYRASLDGKELKSVTPEPGTHAISFSPDGSYFTDSYSSIMTMPELRLCDAAGTIKKSWSSKPAPAVAEYGVKDPSLVRITARDGYGLDATVLLPDRKGDELLPIWIDTYSGPDSPTVRNSHRISAWHQFLRQQGVIVLQCNVRSASGGGQVATGTCYKQLLVQELRDLEDAVAFVCKEFQGDPSRVGITGYSYGGSMTAYALTHSKAFALGVAGAGVYDWQLYDTIYTERYMQTPQMNPEGYKKTSVIEGAKDLNGRLFLIHGTMDDNVHLQNTLRLSYALQVAGKDFEMMLYPKSRHGIALPPLRAHMQKLTWRAIRETLLQKATSGVTTASDTPSVGGGRSKDAELDHTGDAQLRLEKLAAAEAPLRQLADFAKKSRVDTGKADWRTSLPKPPMVEFPADQEYFWQLTTNLGDIKIRLMPKIAPMHVSSTIYLTQLGFYDGLTFHRVIPAFMAQGGDPEGTGRGGPGYKYGGEFDKSVRHDKAGRLSMANAGPGTEGSQFFITFKATPWLDDKHTIFGEVVEGMATVNELEKAGSQTGQTGRKLTIERATITLQ